MQIKPRAEVDRAWKEHYQQRITNARKKHEKRIRGLGLVVRLEDGRTMAFRGRQYEVPPVPWRLAIRVVAVQEQWERLHGQDAPTMDEWLALEDSVGRLSKAVARPLTGWRRLLWPLLPNPFRQATPEEVGECLRFFSLCLIMDQSGSRLATLARLGISQVTSPASSPGSRSGASAAFRKAGSTS